MHSYTVSLRIESPALDTAQVTKELGLTPTQTSAAGERRSPQTVWQKALWKLEVFPENRDHWDSFEAGLGTLIDIFSNHRDSLRTYCANHDVFFWVGHFSSSFDGGPRLSAEILKKLGDFGISIYIDTYFSQP